MCKYLEAQRMGATTPNGLSGPLDTLPSVHSYDSSIPTEIHLAEAEADAISLCCH